MIKIENIDVYGWEADVRGHPGFKATRDGQIIGCSRELVGRKRREMNL